MGWRAKSQSQENRPQGVLNQWSTTAETTEGHSSMTPRQFKAWLKKHGCTFESGHGGHLIVRLGRRKSVVPMHGKKEMPVGTREAIKKDLGLKEPPLGR